MLREGVSGELDFRLGRLPRLPGLTDNIPELDGLGPAPRSRVLTSTRPTSTSGDRLSGGLGRAFFVLSGDLITMLALCEERRTAGSA